MSTKPPAHHESMRTCQPFGTALPSASLIVPWVQVFPSVDESRNTFVGVMPSNLVPATTSGSSPALAPAELREPTRAVAAAGPAAVPDAQIPAYFFPRLPPDQ